MLAFVVVAIGIVCQRRMDDSTAEVSKDEKCETLEKKNEYSTNSTIARITIQNLIERSCIGSIWAYPRTYLD